MQAAMRVPGRTKAAQPEEGRKDIDKQSAGTGAGEVEHEGEGRKGEASERRGHDLQGTEEERKCAHT